jgi:hypothetical protein
LVVAVNEPHVPVTVTLYVPVATELSADRVSALAPVVGLGLNDAVTPAGRPEAARLTLPVKPYKGFTVMVDTPDAPRTAVRAEGEAPREKLGGGGPTYTDISAMAVCPPSVPVMITV